MFWGRKGISVNVIIIIILIIFYPLFLIQNSSADLSNPSILQNRNPIYINGDSQFTFLNGVIGGFGTKASPFIISDWSINATTGHGIKIENTDAYFTISNCYIYNGTNGIPGKHGIVLKNVNNGTIIDCNFTYNSFGIYSLGSNYNKIINNSFFNNNKGIYFYTISNNNVIYNNKFRFNLEGGIRIRDYSDKNEINNNIFTNSNPEIVLFYDCCFNKIIGNNIFNSNRTGAWGINIHYRSDKNFIANNTISRVQYAISLGIFTKSNIVINNTCINSEKGIHIYNSKSNKIINNTILRNDEGLFLYEYSDSNKIANNTIKFNKNYGINITAYKGACKDNLIYNNYFNNTINFKEEEGCFNTWNISKTAGKNIIGGPYLGGNFWSDYYGRDTNNDGLGDTPYGHGDWLPLVDLAPPGLLDNTSGIPTTGDEFIFTATAWDDILLRSVHVNYWYDCGLGDNFTMNMSGGNYQNATYSQLINVSSNATKLYYNMSVTDTGSNWVATPLKILDVIDNDKPELIDETDGHPTTGDTFEIKALVNDNIMVVDVFVEYWFDDGVKDNKSLSNQLGFYNKSIIVPENAEILRYTLSTVDSSNNWVTLGLNPLDVKDNDKPAIIDLSGIPSTDEDYTFSFEITDNIELQIVFLEYWFDAGVHNHETLSESYEYKTSIPNNAFMVNYIVEAVDTMNNRLKAQFNKSVIDNDLPDLQDKTSGSPETGNEFCVKCSVTENRQLGNVTLEYWFDNNAYIDSDMELKNNDLHELTLKVPINAIKLHYKIFAEDTENNIISIDNKKDVIDIIPPTIIDQTKGTPTTGDEFEIKASITDNIAVSTVQLEYWYDGYDPKTAEFSSSHTITIPADGKRLYYQLQTVDKADKESTLDNDLLIVDNDEPFILDNTAQPTTGDEFEFKITISDNINILSSYIEYWFDDGEHTNVTYQGNIEHSTFVPSNVIVLYYSLFAEDGNENTMRLNKELPVVDNDEPVIIDSSSEIATTGDRFNITTYIKDNTFLLEINLEYRFFEQLLTSGLEFFNGSYIMNITVPHNASELYYSITAMDSSGNNRSLEKMIPVNDNDEPLIIDMSKQKEEKFYFKVEATDNIDVRNVFVHYRFSNDNIELVTLEHDNGIYTKDMPIPAETANITYTIHVVDLSDNVNTTSAKNVEIEIIKKDNEKMAEDDMFWLIPIISLLTIIITICGYFYYRKKKKDKSNRLSEDTKSDNKNLASDKSIDNSLAEHEKYNN
jgi:parallel beta-helix repeat protein